MAQAPPDRRQCPTRADGAVPLIAHWIAPVTCLERQRCHYHKCYTCLYRGLPAAAKPSVPKARPLPRVERPPVWKAV